MVGRAIAIVKSDFDEMIKLKRKLNMLFLKSPTAKIFLEDCLIPFFGGFMGIFFIFWARSYMTEDNQTLKHVATFQDKNGQIYLERHGIQQKETDIYRQKSDTSQLSLIARGSDGFKRTYTRTRILSGIVEPIKDKNGKIIGINEPPEMLDPPGAIWSWPRLEAKSNNGTTVWVVTPTFRNPYQYAELTRIAQALYPARKFVRWLVIDDSTKSADHPKHITNLKEFLLQFNVSFKIIRSKMKAAKQRVLFEPKGVDARRTAISYIRKMKLEGVVYFADDDNTYDSDIFRQMQATQTISVWPTGALTQWTVSSPVVNKSGVVIDFFDAWVANRKFPLDFASFAINTALIHRNRKANIPWIQGYEETVFIKLLNVKKELFQPLAANATEILTWHTKTLKDYLLRSNVRLEKILTQRSHWPMTVLKLLEKYDFLFEGEDKSSKESSITEAQRSSKLKPRHKMKKKKRTKSLEKLDDDMDKMLEAEELGY